MKFSGKYRIYQVVSLLQTFMSKVLLILLVCLFVAKIQLLAQPDVKKDTIIILLTDTQVQLECTQALNDLYNFKFPQAEDKFESLKKDYGWHPLPYFLMGLIEWWKIMPNTKDKSHDETFMAYMDSTIMVAERLHKQLPAYRA